MPNPDTLPTSEDPTGPCPRCGRVSNFVEEASWVIGTEDNSPSWQRAITLRCMGCQASTVVITESLEGSGGPWNAVSWWPIPGAGQLDAAVNVAVASSYDEGMRCLTVGAPRAAVVMFRGALAEIVDDLGSVLAKSKGTLFQQLDEMATEGTLHPSLVEWAKEIRVLGNVGAHPSSLGNVTEDEAADLGKLLRQMITVLYETPARIDRARTSRGSP
jgi:hypothetical protein